MQVPLGRPRRYCSDLCRWHGWSRRTRQRPRVPPSRWHTPADLRAQVLARWDIGLDAAAEADSTLVPLYLGPDHADVHRRDALAFEDWTALTPPGHCVWINAPYMPIAVLSAFLARATMTAARGTPVVGLLPASTGSQWWWKHVIDAGASVEFLRGRLAFTGPESKPGGCAPWSSALVCWDPPTPV